MFSRKRARRWVPGPDGSLPAGTLFEFWPRGNPGTGDRELRPGRGDCNPSRAECSFVKALTSQGREMGVGEERGQYGFTHLHANTCKRCCVLVSWEGWGAEQGETGEQRQWHRKVVATWTGRGHVSEHLVDPLIVACAELCSLRRDLFAQMCWRDAHCGAAQL